MPINVLQLSDTHFGASGYAAETDAEAGGKAGKGGEGGEDREGAEDRERDAESRLRKVLEAYDAAETPADLVLLTGDLADDGSTAAYRRLAEVIAELALPVLAVPGNHDSPERLREFFDTEEIEFGQWRVLGIDTSRPGQIHGEVDVADVTRRLDTPVPEGNANTAQRFTLVALHHPPLSCTNHKWFQLTGADALLEALEQRPYVKAVASGHLHWPFELRSHEGLPVLGCPSTFVTIHHDDDQVSIGGSEATGARLIELLDDGSIASQVLRA